MAARKKLLLARHALAEPTIAGFSDADRNLTPGGESQACALGAFLDRWDVKLDRVLASDARRVRQTVDAMLGASGSRHADPQFLPNFYNASMQILGGAVRACPDEVNTVLIVSHNPGLGMLAAHLSAPQAKPKSYPEATLSIFDVCCPWDMITPHYAILEDLVTPTPDPEPMADNTQHSEPPRRSMPRDMPA